MTAGAFSDGGGGTAGERRGRGQMQVLATVAFMGCFYACSLLGPLGPDVQDRLALSGLELSAMVAVPLLLGSLMRIPLEFLTDRHGGRLVFSLLAVQECGATYDYRAYILYRQRYRAVR